MNDKSPLIKICGVKTPKLAEQAVILGANYIGIVFHPESKRFVTMPRAIEIAAAVRVNGGKAVAVFVHQSADEMQQICCQTNIEIVQLHGFISKKQHHQLPPHYQRIYVQSVSRDGSVVADHSAGLNHCLVNRDYRLLDTNQAGSGNPFNWCGFKNTTPYRLGLAGGLNATNLPLAMKIIQPALVDVSSGVENSVGEKEITLIEQFISAAKKGA